MRFSIAKYWLFLPLKDIWLIALIVLFIDGLLTWARLWTLFHYTHVERPMVYGAMVVLWVFWQIEQVSGYALTKLLLGKKLRIQVSIDGVRAGCGRKLNRLPTEFGIGFSVRDIVTGDSDEVFRRSRVVTAIVADSSRQDLAEVLGEQKAELIVSNANLILSIGGTPHEPERDMDPSRGIGAA